MSKRLVVFDLGKVLLNGGPLASLFERIAEMRSICSEDIYSLYRQAQIGGVELREALWTGEIPECTFWNWVRALAGSGSIKGWRSEALKSLQIERDLSAELRRWAEQAEIAVLSNHRHEWVEPHLDALGIRELTDRIYISDLIGHKKPDPLAYEAVSADWEGPPQSIVFVDDKQSYRAGALRAGWQVIDGSDQDWPFELEKWLSTPAKLQAA